MSEQSWWQRTIAAIKGEYERRIRRASLVSEYGAGHHGPDHGESHGEAPEAHDHPEPDDGEVAEIVNVPKGTPVGRRARPSPPPDAEHPQA